MVQRLGKKFPERNRVTGYLVPQETLHPVPNFLGNVAYPRKFGIPPLKLGNVVSWVQNIYPNALLVLQPHQDEYWCLSR